MPFRPLSDKFGMKTGQSVRQCRSVRIGSSRAETLGSYTSKTVTGYPEVDACPRIAPMKSYRFDHQVIVVGNELCTHGGYVRNVDYFDKQREHINGDYFPNPRY